LAISAVARVAALKNVDFPTLGFPTTPSKREYEPAIMNPVYCVGFSTINSYPSKCVVAFESAAPFSFSTFNGAKIRQ
jgi:hypothetical protein